MYQLGILDNMKSAYQILFDSLVQNQGQTKGIVLQEQTLDVICPNHLFICSSPREVVSTRCCDLVSARPWNLGFSNY